MSKENSDLGEQVISKAAEIGVASQLDVVEELDIDIRTNPGKLVQGELDSVEVSGKGLVMRQDLRMETLEVNTGKVAINPLSAVLGNVELTDPAHAQARITLTEADINRAFNSGYIQPKLQGLRMQVDQEPVTVDVQQATVNLSDDHQFVITADFLLKEKNEVKTLSATAIPTIQENGHRIGLEILDASGQGLTSDVVAAIFEQFTNLLDLRNFNIPGMSLQLEQLDVQANQLVIQAKTQIRRIPSA